MGIRISRYTLKQFKEQSGIYEVDSKRVTTPESAVNIINAVLQLEREAQELFGILTLDTKNNIAGVHTVGMGTLNAALVHPREVFKHAILNNAASLIAFHNHPSGDPTPSPEDISLTKRLMESGELIGIEVLDHLVIGDNGRFKSLKQMGVA